MAQTKLPAAMRKQQGFMKEASKRYNAADNIKGYAADGSPIHRVKWLPMVAKVRKEKAGQTKGGAMGAPASLSNKIVSNIVHKVGDTFLGEKIVHIIANKKGFYSTASAQQIHPFAKIYIQLESGRKIEYEFHSKPSKKSLKGVPSKAKPIY
jgi:hypothetical protein